MTDSTNQNLETTNWGRVRNANLIFLVSTVLVFISGIFFVIVAHLNKALGYFDEAHSTIKNLFGSDLAIQSDAIYIPSLIGVIGLAVAFFTTLIVVFSLKRIIKKAKVVRITYILVFVTSIIFVFILAIAEFSYARFSLTYGVIADDNMRKLLAIDQDTTIQKIADYHKMHVYGWTNARATWWLQFARLTLIVIGYLTFHSTFLSSNKYAEEVSKNIESTIKKANIGKSRFNKLLSRVFSSSEKATSYWVLIVTLIVLAPELAYAILLTLDNSEISRVLEWTLVAKDFVRNADGLSSMATAMDQVSGSNSLLLIHLPIIIVGVTLTTSIAFIFNIIRDWRIDTRTFAVQLVLSLIEIVVALVFGAISKGSLNSIVNQWNSQDIHGIVAQLDVTKLGYITSFFALPTFNSSNQVNHVWLYGFEYISEFVISFFFIGTCYTILTHKIYVITKMRQAEKTRIINNNNNANVELAK